MSEKNDLNKITKKEPKIDAQGLNIDWLFKNDIGLDEMPLKVTVLYALIGALWILFSDRILYLLIESKSLMLRIQTIKGWAYVLLSTFIIYFLINQFTKKVSFILTH